MKNLDENQILKNEELSQVLGGASDTNILSGNDESNDVDSSVGSGCTGTTCKSACVSGCQSGCMGMCIQDAGKDGYKVVNSL